MEMVSKPSYKNKENRGSQLGTPKNRKIFKKISLSNLL
jgi:hypothetical protein